jgi:translocation and assembly module TamB
VSRRARRILLHVAVGLATVLAVGTGAVLWAVATQPGAQWAFERLGAIFPGELHVETLHGPIRGPLAVRRLVYTSNALDMTIDHVALDWRLSRLLVKQLDVLALEADNVQLRFKSHEEARRDSLARPLPDVDLPVSVIIRGAHIRHLQIWTPASPRPTVLDSITLVTRAWRDTLGVTNLAVRSARADIDVRGKALPQGAYPVDLTVDWRLRPEGRRELQGSGRLHGTLDSLLVDQRLTAPWLVHLVGRVDHMLRKPAFDGHATFAGVPLREFNPGWPDVVASGAVQGGGRAADFSAQGRVRAVTSAWGTLDTDFDLTQGMDGWTLHRMEVAPVGRPTRVTLTGRLGPHGGPMRVAGAWRDLEWPLRGRPTLTSPRGTLTLNGAPSRYAFVARAEVASPRIVAGAWNMRGRGDGRGANVEDLSTPVMGGRLAGRGRFDWRPDVRWRMALAGSGLYPGTKWPALAGRVDLAGVSEGRVTRGGAVGTARIDRLAGTAGGRPVSGLGTLQLAGGHAVLSGAQLRLGTATATAAGAVGGPWSLRWNVDAPDLAQALPWGGGVLHARGSVLGASASPRIQATVHGDSLTLGDRHVRRLVADADLRLAGGALTLDLDASGVMLGRRRIDHFALQSRGPRARNVVTVRSTTGPDSLQLVLAGALGAHEWRGRVRTLDLHSRAAGTWTLAAAAPLVLRQDGVSLRELCWRSGSVRACAAVLEWSRSGPFRVDATLVHVPLELARFWMPGDAVAHGPVDGRVHAVQSPGGALAADAQLSPGPGWLSFPGEAGRDSVPFDRGTIGLSTSGGQIVATTRLTFPGQGTVAADVRAPARAGLVPSRRPLAGAVHLHLRDLLLLEAVQADMTHPHGTLDADLDLGGTVAHPAIAGQLALRGGSMDVPRFGLHLTGMTADMRGSRGGIALDLAAQSGPGTLHMRGRGALAAWPPSGTVTLSGTVVQVMNTKDVRLQASPDLTAKLGQGRADITGRIAFPSGDVTVQRRTEAALVRPSRDVVIVGSAASADTGQALAMYSRVRIDVSPGVVVHGFGFDVTPEGSIVAMDRPGHPTTANGELDVKQGTFTAYGRKLAIEHGQLYFAGGPITDPAVNLRCTRTARDGTVAVLDVHGTAASPDMTVSSRPSKPQREALSYLVFGRPPQQGSTDDARLLEDATNALGLNGGAFLAGRIGRAMGLSETQLTSMGQLQESALSLGKYLSPRLYVQYGVGLFSPVNTLRMRYVVNRVLTLQVESADQTRADVLINAER